MYKKKRREIGNSHRRILNDQNQYFQTKHVNVGPLNYLGKLFGRMSHCNKLDIILLFGEKKKELDGLRVE